MKKEIFKPIPYYEDYLISNLGNVYSMKSYRLMDGNIGNRGYLIVSLRKNGTHKVRTIHQLVAIVFMNHKPDGMNKVINHIDLNRLNNNVNNLEIVSQRDNANMKHVKSSSKYIGVSWNKYAKKWSASIHIDKKIHLGYFVDEYDAHLSYQNKLKTL